MKNKAAGSLQAASCSIAVYFSLRASLRDHKTDGFGQTAFATAVDGGHGDFRRGIRRKTLDDEVEVSEFRRGHTPHPPPPPSCRCDSVRHAPHDPISTPRTLVPPAPRAGS